MKKYRVWSPVMFEDIDPYGHPCGDFVACVDVTADNQRAAKVKAIKHPEFSDWVWDARGNFHNPFSGLKVSRIE